MAATDTSLQPTAADPGLFGPDSVTWRVMREPAAFVAGLRALLAQSLHPVVAAAFDAHSDYRQRMWQRLTRTGEYLQVVTFGTHEEVDRVAAMVRRAHDRVWRDPETGVDHRLDDPHLQLWVHACLVDSFLDVTVRSGLALSGADQDRFVAEQVRAAELVGIPAADAPADRAALTRYLEGMAGSLRLTPPAITEVAAIAAPPMPLPLALLTPARPGWTALMALAYGSLPAWAREQFPVPSGLTPLARPAVTMGLRAVRTSGLAVLGLLPTALHNPHEAAALRRLGLA